MLDLVVTSRLGVRFANRPPLSESDVLDRIELLERTSARSIAALSGAKPTWLIQTDVANVDLVRSSLGELVKTMDETIRFDVVARVDGGFEPDSFEGLHLPDRFLCLRLDADDYYLPRPVLAALTDFQDEPEGTLIDFPRGYLVDLEGGKARRLTYSVQGPFYGVVTSPLNPIAAIGPHGAARDGRHCVEQLDRAWIQTVHESNIFTQYRRSGRVSEAKSMVKQIRRARGTRPIGQLAVRPLDLLPLRRSAQRSISSVVN